MRALRLGLLGACLSVTRLCPAETGSTNAAEQSDAAAPTRQEAERLYAEGEHLYNAGDYAGAASAFERAYELSHIPELLFDIGQAHRLAGPSHCAAARRTYAAYLEAVPDSEHRPIVVEHLAQLASCEGVSAEPVAVATERQPPAQKPEPATAASEDSERPVVPWIVTGAGAAVALTGGALWLRAKIEYEDVRESCPCPEGKFDSWERLTYVSYGLVAAGVITASVGVVLWQSGRERQSVRLDLAPSGVAITASM